MDDHRGSHIHIIKETRPQAGNAKQLSEVSRLSDAEVDRILAGPEPPPPETKWQRAKRKKEQAHG